MLETGSRGTRTQGPARIAAVMVSAAGLVSMASPALLLKYIQTAGRGSHPGQTVAALIHAQTLTRETVRADLLPLVLQDLTVPAE